MIVKVYLGKGGGQRSPNRRLIATTERDNNDTRVWQLPGEMQTTFTLNHNNNHAGVYGAHFFAFASADSNVKVR